MKCLVCGEKTNNRLLCKNHMGMDTPLRYLTVHVCGSFSQKKGEPQGICEFRLVCEPIKRALKHEALISGNLGHIVCPYAEMNLRKTIYSNISEEEIKGNYPECTN